LPRAATLLAAFLVTCAPLRARGWTDARVRSVSTEIHIASDARADVSLVARVRVDRGWLQSFEMDGLDPDLAFIPERPVTFGEENGRMLSPRVEHAGEGRVVFEFGRRSAPRRGDYIASIAYRTELARNTELDEAGHVIVRWTMPSWRYGLDDVVITIDAPHGARAVLAEGEDGTVEATHIDSAVGSRVTLHRAHLPRTREWSIAIAIPSGMMDAALRVPREIRASPVVRTAPSDDNVPRSHIAGLALFLAILALAKIFIVVRASMRSRVPPRPLLPLSAKSRSGLVIAAALGAVFYKSEPEVVALLFVVIGISAIHLRAGTPRPPRLGSFRVASAEELAQARRALRDERFGLAAWFDPTTIPGMISFVACSAAPLILSACHILPAPWPLACLTSALVGAILLAETRRSRPMPPLSALAHLLRLASNTRCDLESERRWMLRPVLHTDVRGELQDARLRIVLPATPKGLLRLDVVFAIQAERAHFQNELQLLIVTREGSAADRALEERFAETRIATAPRRTARQLPLGRGLPNQLAPILDALAHCPIDQAPTGQSTAHHTEQKSLAASA
jgi:hypothetical protein